ncbi:MAG: hypothetical protein ACYC5O_08825 [Anaerolineae bacterium]
MERLFQWLDEFKNANMVRSAFGEPHQEAGRTVIPVALVAQRIGGGVCSESACCSPEQAARDSAAGFTRPLGVISIGSEGVRVHEIVDSTAVSISGIALAALMVLLVYRLLSAGLRQRGS